MLALSSYGMAVVRVSLSVYIATRWYTGQEVLWVKNHNDITFTFTCDKGMVQLPPHVEWHHGYINGATAIRTMGSIQIIEVWHRGRQLFAHEVQLIFHRNDISFGVRGDQWVSSNPGKVIRLALGDPTALMTGDA